MNEWLRQLLHLVMICVVVALISISMNLLVEIRILQIRMDRMAPAFEKRDYNQI